VLAVAGAAVPGPARSPIRSPFANSLSGPVRPGRDESLVDAACNRRGERPGWRQRTAIELVLFDERSNPAVARANARRICHSPVRRRLGQFLQLHSARTAPAYNYGESRAAGRRAADDLTSGNESLFSLAAVRSPCRRARLRTSALCDEEPKIPPRSPRDSYGSSFVSGFAGAYPLVAVACVRTWNFASGQIGSMDERWMAGRAESWTRVIVIGAQPICR